MARRVRSSAPGASGHLEIGMIGQPGLPSPRSRSAPAAWHWTTARGCSSTQTT